MLFLAAPIVTEAQAVVGAAVVTGASGIGSSAAKTVGQGTAGVLGKVGTLTSTAAAGVRSAPASIAVRSVGASTTTAAEEEALGEAVVLRESWGMARVEGSPEPEPPSAGDALFPSLRQADSVGPTTQNATCAAQRGWTLEQARGTLGAPAVAIRNLSAQGYDAKYVFQLSGGARCTILTRSDVVWDVAVAP